MNKLGILKHRVFRNFFFASLIGLFGEGILGLTNIVVVEKTTNSVMAISYMIILTMLPSVFLAPFGGVLIDRFNKAKVALWCNLIRFVCILSLAFLYYAHLFSIGVLYAAVFICYLVFHLLNPTTESMLKEALSPAEYMQGVSLTQAAWQVGLLSSGLVAGALVQYAGLPAAMMVASATYLVGAILYLGIVSVYKPQERTDKPSQALGFKHYLSDIKQGWGYLLQNKTVFYFSLGACISYPFFSGINILVGPFNFKVVNGNDFTLGLINSGAGIGALISAAVCLWLSKKKGTANYLIASIVLLCFATFGFSRTHNYLSAFLMYIAIGLFIGNVKVLTKTLVYQHVETSFVGRTMTTINMLSLGSATIFSYLIGRLGQKDVVSAYLAVIVLLIVPIVFTLLGQFYVGLEAKRKLATNHAPDTTA